MAYRGKKAGKQPSSSIPKKSENKRSSKDQTTAVSARIRKIGNSRGILLSNSILAASGIEDHAEVVVTTENGCIIIRPAEKKRTINTDLATWEAQFKAAIKNGDTPETDLFGGMENKFDKEEW